MSTNLLLVSPYSLNYFGGVQNQLLLIKKFLPKEDYNLKFLCPDSPDFNLGKPIKMPFNGSVAPIALFANKKTILKAISWADVVHLHEPFIPLFFWRFPVDKRTIISHHASLSILLSLVQKKLIKKERHAHAVTAVSKEASKHVVSSVDVQIVPNAIELTNNSQHFSGGSDILFIGRNEKRKNYKLYEQLSSVAKNKKYNFRAITNQNIHSENISVFVNPDNGIKEGLLKKSSIYLAVNTHGESFGITIVEAINSGCIAICSDIQPFKELLEDSGIYFKNNDLDSLTLAVENITSKDVTNIYLKQLKHIRKYDIDKVITSWISLYSQI